jgi:hypothetical protein
VHLHAYGCEFTARRSRDLHVRCPLAGVHQLTNAVTAAAVLDALDVPVDGIADAQWPGRLQRIGDDPEIVLDGAHNPAGARALAEHMRRFYNGRTIWLVYGAMRDKSVEEIMEILFRCGCADRTRFAARRAPGGDPVSGGPSRHPRGTDRGAGVCSGAFGSAGRCSVHHRIVVSGRRDPVPHTMKVPGCRSAFCARCSSPIR